MRTDISTKTNPVARTAVKKPLPMLDPAARYHRTRKAIQLICFLIFVALPFFNLMRFDLLRQRFYFAGYELWINEFAIIFFTLMFLLFVIAAAAMLYGRIYCGYLCPQMIFSEASLGLEERLNKFVNKRFIKWPKGRRQMVSRILFYLALGFVSIFLAFVFISYFVEPRDLLLRLLNLDIQTWGGLAGAVTTLIAFLDFAFVRTRFCTTACPYGYLQGILGDKETLIVEYRDPQHDCIECKKCVRVCHMGIDIRKSPYQIECIHCGECVDACNDVLERLGKPGLIHYAWGENGPVLSAKPTNKIMPWHQRLGLRDAKRAVVLFIILFYASGLFVALAMRDNVLVTIAPIRITMYRVGDDGQIYNRFRLTVANRQSREARVEFSLIGLANASLISLPSLLQLQPNQTIQQEFEIAVPTGSLSPGVNHFEITTRVLPNNEQQTFKETFITPSKRP